MPLNYVHICNKTICSVCQYYYCSNCYNGCPKCGQGKITITTTVGTALIPTPNCADGEIKQKTIGGQLRHIGSIGSLIDGLMEQFNNNNIEALCLCILTKDKEIYIGWDKDSKFLDRIGMATLLVQDMYEATKE